NEEKEEYNTKTSGYQNACNSRRASPRSQPRPILHVPNPIPSNMGNVQESQSLILDGGGGGPLVGPPSLGLPHQRRAPPHHPRPCLLRHLRQHRPRKCRRQIHEGNLGCRGPRLLRLPDHHRYHPLRRQKGLIAGKLHSKWDRPFVVTNIFPYGQV
ncbi:hypothetical protein CR513_61683, partial [Mucuna pruriens]